MGVAVGLTVGFTVGFAVGFAVGGEVGSKVGSKVESKTGQMLDRKKGSNIGWKEGSVDIKVGLEVGSGNVPSFDRNTGNRSWQQG